MRFAVHWPGQPASLAARSRHALPRCSWPHSCPRRRETAGGAPEDGLALARLRVHVPARRAALARIRGIDLLTRPGAFSSSLRTRIPQPEARISRFSPAFALTFLPGLLAGAFSRAGHVRHSQILEANYVEPPGQVGRQLLGPVFAGVGFAGFQPAIADLSRARRLLPRLARASLRWSLQPTLASGGQARASEQFAGGQRRADRDPTVHAHHLAGPRPCDGVWDRGERDVPAAGRSNFTRNDLAPGRRGTSGTAPSRPSARKPAPSGGSACRTWSALTATIRNPSSRPALRQVGLRCVPSKMVRHCLGEIPQRLLLDDHAACRQPPVLSRAAGKLAALLYPARRAVRPERHHDCCSTARFHTKRACAQWPRNTSACVGDGRRR